ncbi:MAG: hypothetical protein KGI93_06740 [Acidobacteriota bacterium]|nr:hypothetical protein [Acidobacteriota bacterium]MDE3190689.1 hypothetical protein [Acidobacteriota bacterium]
MRWKAFGIVLAAVLAVPLAALAGNNNPQPSSISPTTTTTPGSNAKPRTDGGHWFAGSVTSAGSGSISVDVLVTGKHDTELDGRNVTVAIDASTQITYGKGKSSIEAGDLVGVAATGPDLSSLTAKKINVRCNCHFAAGTLGSVGSSSFALNVSRTGPYDTVLKGNAVTFQVNGSTTFVQGKDKTAGTLSDLKTGEQVAVVFSASGFFKDPSFNWQTATFTAEKVHYRGDLQPAPTNP